MADLENGLLLATVLDEVKLLSVLFGNWPSMVGEIDDMAGGVSALLIHMTNQLEDLQVAFAETKQV